MGKVAQNNSKYVIKAKMESGGLVEKPDIVGAIFGQTEGLLDEQMDLRELQERGKVGRMQVDVDNEDGRSKADIRIPSSLNAADTSIIAASLETIERVGPSAASIKVEAIEDQRVSKRDYIVKRAKQLLSDIRDERPESQSIEREVKEEVRQAQITSLNGFDAGPGAENSGEVILVEGKADLQRLLRFGVENAVAIGGTSVPDSIVDVAGDKHVTAFVDGDRGGDLILEELKSKINVDQVSKAPKGMEVEELEKKTLFEALRDSESTDRVETDPAEKVSETVRENLSEVLNDLVGTRALVALDRDFEEVQRFPVSKAGDVDDCYAVVFDGEIDSSIIGDVADHADILVGMKKSSRAKSEDLILLTREEL